MALESSSRGRIRFRGKRSAVPHAQKPPVDAGAWSRCRSGVPPPPCEWRKRWIALGEGAAGPSRCRPRDVLRRLARRRGLISRISCLCLSFTVGRAQTRGRHADGSPGAWRPRGRCRAPTVRCRHLRFIYPQPYGPRLTRHHGGVASRAVRDLGPDTGYGVRSGGADRLGAAAGGSGGAAALGGPYRFGGPAHRRGVGRSARRQRVEPGPHLCLAAAITADRGRRDAPGDRAGRLPCCA